MKVFTVLQLSSGKICITRLYYMALNSTYKQWV
jgi:hypothetical protein